MIDCRIQKIHPNAHLPSQTHAGDVGWDLYAVEGTMLVPGQRQTLSLGFSASFPVGYVASIRDRSGMGSKGIHCLAGVIDPSYRGEWKVVLLNTTPEPFEVKTGDRIAQCLFLPVPEVTMTEVSNLEETSRGSGGFGSTGA